MAMPETKIGFFPDVGATGWMFLRCPRGYPEYLGLTGYDMTGAECVRLGFATHFMESKDISDVIEILENYELENGISKETARKNILKQIERYLDYNISSNQDMDDWVATYFSGKSDLNGILDSLRKCGVQRELCDKVFVSIAERSPTALALTLKLLRYNEGRPLPEVFATELKAAEFITRHPDYIEGIRARLIDKDDKPHWRPDKLAEVDLSNFKI
jgi:enoyl-CoA hydratase/carnithine racemase